MKKIYFLFLLTLLPLVASADVLEIHGIYYNLYSSSDFIITAVTQNPHKCTDDVIIPYSVSYESVDYSVTTIGVRAFNECSGVKFIFIPNSVISIGRSAFYGCNRLNKVIFSDIISSINEYIFSGCSHYYLPKSLKL